MATRSERVFAWVGVGVAVLSTVALSAAVVIQQIITDHNTSQQQQQQTSLACVDNNTEQPLDAPTKYVATSSVTSLEVTDLQKGSGPAAKAGDCLITKYYGMLASNGQVFDQNYTQTTAFPFHLGQGEVIKGWDEGLVGMQAGGERRLVIPADLGYGSQSSAQIPANSALVFYVKLLRIQ